MAVLIRQFVDEDAVDELIRRLVLTVATGNGDAHLKNWSLVYPDRVHAAWSPLYDQVATVGWRAHARALALKMGGAKEFGRIDRDVFERLADRAGIDRPRLHALIDQTLDRLRRAWVELGSGLPLIPAHREAIEELWRRVPLLRAAGGLG